MVGRAPVGCGKGRKFESWTFSQKVCRTNCTKHTLKGEDSSLNNSRTLRSYCVAKIYNPPTHPHITKSDTMQIFRSMTWLCVHGLWDSYWFQPNTEASLTTAVTTIAVALHILKCTLCKITFSTLNGSAVIFPEVCVLDICFCDTLDIWLTGFIIKIFEITRLRQM